MAPTKEDARNVKWQWQFETGVHGTYAIIGTHHTCPSPVCVVWCRFPFAGGCIEIVDSFVRHAFTRIGIRTLANDFIFSSYDKSVINRIVTQSGTESGAAFMASTGYRRAKDGHWYVTRKQWTDAKKRNAKA